VNTGARSILLPSYPSLATLPFAFTQPEVYQNFLSQYTEDLKAGLSNISKAYKSKAKIVVVDIYRKFDKVIANPRKYGLDPDEIRTACLQGAYGEAPRSLCDDPDKHLWFDAYHPTRVGHEIVAEVFQKALESL
jgi:phospholipase/lecithinase/hemolysin